MQIIKVIGFSLFCGCMTVQCSNQPTVTEKNVGAAAPAPSINESPTGKDLEALRNNKIRKIDTVSSRTDAVYHQKPDKPPLEIKVEKSTEAAGPTAYVNKNNMALQIEPKANAAQTAALKIYEQVIILETKMTDEAGKNQAVPSWYKVQKADKKQGWVVANAVTIN